MSDVERNTGKVKSDKPEPTKASPSQRKRVAKASQPSSMEQQLNTSEIMDAVACFSMSKRFRFVEYDINRITAIHQSGAIVTITFK